MLHFPPIRRGAFFNLRQRVSQGVEISSKLVPRAACPLLLADAGVRGGVDAGDEGGVLDLALVALRGEEGVVGQGALPMRLHGSEGVDLARYALHAEGARRGLLVWGRWAGSLFYQF